MGLFFKNMKRPAVSQSRRATEVVADIDFIDENANSFLTDLNLQPIVKYDIMIS
jgi:hypothetical protein